jgi:hypothetical protein
MFSVDSDLFKIPLKRLHPTQITVGFAEVEKKRRSWAKMNSTKRKAAMEEQLFPVVRGPRSRFYIIDHHHTALALLREGAGHVLAGLVQDLSHLKPEAFWTFLDHYSWMHAYDARGRKRSPREIPYRLRNLKDDPYRSFAAFVRDAGGYAKPVEPFQEFLWANFFREEIPSKLLRHKQNAMKRALKLAHSDKAAHLPGWSGAK